MAMRFKLASKLHQYAQIGLSLLFLYGIEVLETKMLIEFVEPINLMHNFGRKCRLFTKLMGNIA